MAPFEARQAEPQPRRSWKRKEREEAQELQDAADSIKVSKPEEAASLQVVPAWTPRKNHGGRPKKTAGAGKSPYTTLTGPQKVWTALQCKELLQVPGARRSQTFAKAAKEVGCSAQVAQDTYREQDFWLDWASKRGTHASKKAGTWRKPGEKQAMPGKAV